MAEGKWSEMMLSTWDSTRFPDAARAYDVVRDYVTAVRAGGNNWLYLCGPYGIGKTHLAVSAVRALIETNFWPAYAVVWPEHCAQVQESWDAGYSGQSEGQLWNRMRGAKLLLIDDLDKRYPTPWAIGKLYEIVEHRYRLEKPTIITANRSIDTLAAFWGNIDMGRDQWKALQIQDAGSAIMSRIAGQLWGAIEMRGKDQRW
jgi:DNA replication protein DnaC